MNIVTEFQNAGYLPVGAFRRYGELWRLSFGDGSKAITFVARVSIIAIHTLVLLVIAAIYLGGAWGLVLVLGSLTR